MWIDLFVAPPADPNWSERLNARVKRKVDKFKADPKCKDMPAVLALQQKKTIVRAGFPVYEERPIALFCIATIGSCATIAYNLYMQWQLTLALGCACLVIYDFFSGLLHVVLDHPPNVGLPFVGQACLEFQWHHYVPDDIVVKGLVQCCADLVLAVGAMGAWFVAVSFALPNMFPLLPIAISWKILWAYYGQYSHRSSHAIGKQRGTVARFLQKVGLIVHPTIHHKHHTDPHDTHFCLIGWSDPLVQLMHDYLSPSLILFIWLVLCLTDMLVLAKCGEAFQFQQAPVVA